MKLSVAVIVKNEEKAIKACLASVADADEIVVVDTGSSDNTISVSQACGAIVHQFEWCDDFAAARNYAISKTTGDWVLVIDSDEVMESGGVGVIRQHLESDVRGFYLDISGVKKHRSIRVIRPDVLYFGAIHETPSCSTTGCIPVAIKAGTGAYRGQDPDRNIRILNACLKQSRYPRNLYYLAREHYYYKDYRKTLMVLNKYFAVGFWLPELGDAFLIKARCHWHLHEGEEARLACLRALNCNANHREAAEFMAEITFPENARVWRAMAEIADNSKVLFLPATESIR